MSIKIVLDQPQDLPSDIIDVKHYSLIVRLLEQCANTRNDFIGAVAGIDNGFQAVVYPCEVGRCSLEPVQACSTTSRDSGKWLSDFVHHCRGRCFDAHKSIGALTA